ncbi:hypothetical protein KIN20_021837 [Parelaphostrongylus tenuis]|uniref:Uncharacterized protein n=1 Tax=Parelaphostrongylus tenuis TaxID=148309 RepID=A0AAD5MUP4_PARTN|nr:hypothetical protein KIN20_021837 [Parelaphostrongylus tenuis]
MESPITTYEFLEQGNYPQPGVGFHYFNGNDMIIERDNPHALKIPEINEGSRAIHKQLIVTFLDYSLSPIFFTPMEIAITLIRVCHSLGGRYVKGTLL